MKYWRIVSSGLLLGWMLAGLPCLGQLATSQDPSVAGDATPAEESSDGMSQQSVATIPTAEITSQAAETTTRLEQIGVTIQPTAAVTNLALEFSAQARTIAELRSDLNVLNSATATVRQIEDQRREWNQQRDRIDDWAQIADIRWKNLQQTRAELAEMLQRWKRTRDAMVENHLPVEVQGRIDRIIGQIEAVQATLQTRIDQVAEFIERLTDARMTISSSITRLGRISEYVNRRLLNRDAPSLWRIHQTDWAALEETTQQCVAGWFRDFRRFVSHNVPLLLAHVVLFVVLAMVAFVARRASAHWPEDERDLDRARFLVSRPFSTALTFSIVAGYFIYGTLPSAVRDFFYLLLVLPVLRLANGLTERSVRVGLFGLLILGSVFPFVQISPEGSLLMRVLLLVTQLAAIAIVGYAVWSGPARREHRQEWKNGISLVIYCGVLLVFVAAFLANLLGWVSLARFLTESTLLTCYGALLAIIIGMAGAGLLPAFLREGPAQALLSVRRYAASFERFGTVLLALILLFIWSQQSLRRFRLDELFTQQVNAIFATPFSWADIDITVGDVFKAIFILAATFLIQRILRFFLYEELFPRLHMRTSSTAAFATLFKYAIVAAGLTMAGSAIGLSATQLTVLVGALGVGIGFGLQSIVNNFVSGLFLMFERPVKIGDIVEVGGNLGTARKIGVRATAVQTFEGAEIVVPNGDLISKEVKNWTLSDHATRIELNVGVAYGSEPQTVLETLLSTAKEVEFVFSDPAPFAMMFEFGDSALRFRLLCWTSFDKRGVVTSQLHIKVCEALAKAGIAIPFPQRDMHLRPTEELLGELKGMTRTN